MAREPWCALLPPQLSSAYWLWSPSCSSAVATATSRLCPVWVVSTAGQRRFCGSYRRSLGDYADTDCNLACVCCFLWFCIKPMRYIYHPQLDCYLVVVNSDCSRPCELTLRVAIDISVGAGVCIPHSCRCGGRMDSITLHGLSYNYSVGRFPRHSAMIGVIKRALQKSG